MYCNIAHCLVFWPKEDTYSVVPRSRLLEGNAIGDSYRLKIGRMTHTGTLVAIGMFLTSILQPLA